MLRSRFWGAHLLMLLAVAATVVLGLWQWHVWGAHRDAKAHDLTSAAAVPLNSVMGGDSPFPGADQGRPVTLSGSWLPASTMYVSGQRHDGRTGYWVVTPVHVDGTSSAMPVVRGWAATTHAPAPQGHVRLTGWLQSSEGDSDDDVDRADDVIPALQIPSLVQHVPMDLYGGFVVLRDAVPAPAGTAAIGPLTVPDVGATESLRNLLYALQWWVFGVVAIYMWVRWLQVQLHPPDAREDDDSSGDPGPGGTPDVGAPAVEPTGPAVPEGQVSSST